MTWPKHRTPTHLAVRRIMVQSKINSMQRISNGGRYRRPSVGIRPVRRLCATGRLDGVTGSGRSRGGRDWQLRRRPGDFARPTLGQHCNRGSQVRGSGRSGYWLLPRSAPEPLESGPRLGRLATNARHRDRGAQQIRLRQGNCWGLQRPRSTPPRCVASEASSGRTVGAATGKPWLHHTDNAAARLTPRCSSHDASSTRATEPRTGCHLRHLAPNPRGGPIGSIMTPKHRQQQPYPTMLL